MIKVRSEIRGVFIHESVYGYPHDWSIIAQTLSQYKINAMFVSDLGIGRRRPDAEISTAIAACHAYGIEYHSSMFALEQNKNAETAAITSGGEIFNEWVQCPIMAHDNGIAAVQEYLTSFPSVDGIMLDYIRYEVADMCYCPQCRAAFEQWLGEGPIEDWTPFYPSGARWLEYAEWRTIPVTELVRDMRAAALAIKPDLVISEAAWSYFSDCPIYWRKWIGQDTGNWIANDYLDFVAPMMYTKTIYGASGETLESFIDATQKYMTGGVEGKIPLVALLRNDFSTSADLTPEELKAQIDYVRSRGLNGWIIWRYGGPGVDDNGYFPDITDYLAILDMPPTFTLSNILYSKNGGEITVSWSTDLPATSRVEYSAEPLFNAVWSVWGGFNYWRINSASKEAFEDLTPKTEHSLIIPSNALYFRVQSKDESGTVTSPIFYTGIMRILSVNSNIAGVPFEIRRIT